MVKNLKMPIGEARKHMSTSFTRQSFLTALGATSLSASLAALSGCSKPDTAPKTLKELSFSILSVEKSQDLEAVWGPIIEDMAKQIGMPVKAYYAPDYTALVEAMRYNKVQAGWFSNVPGLDAINRANGEVFAETVYPDDFAGYKSIIVVHKDSPLTIDAVLKCDQTLSFGMGDAKSTSGTQAPLHYLFVPKNIDPNKCFKAVLPGSHQSNIQGVANHVLDAATNNSTALEELKIRNPELLSKVKVIWESPKLPNDVVIYRKDLDPAIKEKVRSFFLAYGRGDTPEAEAQRKLLRTFVIGGFVPADNSHFLPIRLMQAETDLMQAKQKGDAEAVIKAEETIAAIKAEQAAIDAKKPS